MIEAEDNVAVFCLNDPEHCADLTLWLTEDEIARAERLRRITDRTLYIGSHVLQRYCLWLATGQRYLRLTARPNGKPIVTDHITLHVNLSQCAGMAICGISRHCDVGVDVEKLIGEPPADVEPMVFGAAERAYIGGDGSRFIALWTMKEAVFKASGEPWSDLWRDMSVLPAVTGGALENYATDQSPFGSHFTASVAAKTARRQTFHWVTVTRSDLIIR